MKNIMIAGGFLILLGTALAQTSNPPQQNRRAGASTANFRFEVQFSESGIFDCWNARNKIGIGVGRRNPSPEDRAKAPGAADFSGALTVEIETWPSKKKNKIQRSWGWARFEDGDRKVTVPLDNGQTAYFERFGSTPNWPFKDMKDRQPFFSFRLDNGVSYQCRAVYQAEQ